MKKNFFKFSLILNIACALLSATFMFIYAYLDEKYNGEAFFTFLYYVKTTFDLLAVFVGYATIIYAFANYDFKNGLISIGTFSVSVLISFVTMVIGSSISYTSSFSFDFFVSITFYSAGSCFITQLIPGFLIALATYFITRKGQKRLIKGLISWKNSIQRTMLIVTLVVFGVNLLFYTFASVLPFLIESDFAIYKSELISIITDYIEKIVFYLVVQYLVYFFTYKIYHAYAIKHPDKKERV